jgi:uncharacterized protein YegP (UPF0339 family)
MMHRLRQWLIRALEEPASAFSGNSRYRYWRDGHLWFYALVAGNSEPLSLSQQGYDSESAVLRAIRVHRRNAETQTVVQSLGPPK